MQNPELHSIDKRLAVLETRSEVLPEIKDELKALREKLENQAVKQAGMSATVAIIVSLLFSLLTGKDSKDANYPSHLSIPEHNDSAPIPPESRSAARRDNR